MRDAPVVLSARRSFSRFVPLMLCFALLAAGGSSAAVSSPDRAVGSPTLFSLTFEGAHFSDPTTPFGLRHEGRFTASAPFCSSGHAHDTRQIDDAGSLTAWRVYECDDGSGSFTAFLPIVRNEHAGSGSWKVVEGTGRYAQLRGQGTYIGTHLSGDPNDFSTVAYRAQWQGVVDFDADPPAIESLSATARKLPERVRTYTLRVAVTAADASPIDCTVEVRAGQVPLGLKKVSTTSGQGAATLRIQAPRGARSVRITLAATDVLGNGPTTTSRTIKLAR